MKVLALCRQTLQGNRGSYEEKQHISCGLAGGPRHTGLCAMLVGAEEGGATQ